MDSKLPYIKEPALQVVIANKKDFEQIYRLYWRSLYEFALIKTRDKDVAEEIIQDLFVSIWEKRDELRIINLRNYLFTAVRNRIITFYRQTIFSDLDIATNQEAPDYPLFLEELEMSLNEALSKLPEKTHEIFLLNRFDGKSAAEIARHLHIPQRTVEYHITQALRQLKSLLKNTIAMILFFLNTIIF